MIYIQNILRNFIQNKGNKWVKDKFKLLIDL